MHLVVHDDTPKTQEAVSRVMEIAAVPGLGHILSMNDLGVIFVPRSFTLPIKLLGSILEALISMTAQCPGCTARCRHRQRLRGGEDDMAQDAALYHPGDLATFRKCRKYRCVCDIYIMATTWKFKSLSPSPLPLPKLDRNRLQE